MQWEVAEYLVPCLAFFLEGTKSERKVPRWLSGLFPSRHFLEFYRREGRALQCWSQWERRRKFSKLVNLFPRIGDEMETDRVSTKRRPICDMERILTENLGPLFTRVRKFVHKFIDVACMQCEHSHSQQWVLFVCIWTCTSSVDGALSVSHWGGTHVYIMLLAWKKASNNWRILPFHDWWIQRGKSWLWEV